MTWQVLTLAHYVTSTTTHLIYLMDWPALKATKAKVRKHSFPAYSGINWKTAFSVAWMNILHNICVVQGLTSHLHLLICENCFNTKKISFLLASFLLDMIPMHRVTASYGWIHTLCKWYKRAQQLQFNFKGISLNDLIVNKSASVKGQWQGRKTELEGCLLFSSHTTNMQQHGID